MQTRQTKLYDPSTTSTAAETTPKSAASAPTRLPAWASSWGENPAPGLINPLANLQAKGVVSQPGDPYEQEADQVADQVMGMAAPGASMISAPVDPPGASPRLATPAYHVSPMIQRATVEENTPSPMAADSAPTPDAGTSASAQTADASASPSPQSGITPTEASTAGLIVDDAVDQLGPGQMKKSDFLAQLRDAVCATTEEALKGTIWSAAGCPWVDHWFGYYGNRDSQQIERALRRYAPETASATSAGDYIPIICGRVRNAIAVWSTTGEVAGVPEGMELPGAGLMGAVGSIASGIARTSVK